MEISDPEIVRRIAAIDADLRSLAALAASEGVWAVVRAASVAAERLADTGALIPEHQEKRSDPKVAVPEKHDSTLERRARRGAEGDYPRFEVCDGELVKIGWSRSEKSEYRHKAPKSAVDLLVATVLELSERMGGRFRSDQLFPVISPLDGSDLPNYQAYLILRWLRAIRLVRSSGRSAYVVPRVQSFPDEVNRAWKELSSMGVS